MSCEMCGKSGEMFRAVVEGSSMTLCASCAKYGKITARISQPGKEQKAGITSARRENTREDAREIAANYGQIIKRKREELGLNMKDFAMKIAEKESTLHKIETGEIPIPIERALKLEKQLGIKLVGKAEEEAVVQKSKNSEMTLGDFVKIKPRKKPDA